MRMLQTSAHTRTTRPTRMTPTTSFRPRHARRCLLFAVVALAGCAQLLPRGGDTEPSRFGSYEDAEQALLKVEPYRTTVAELRELGFDVRESSNVQRLPYPQWFTSLLGQQTPLDGADAGIRDCLAAGPACEAYAIRFSRVRHERVGNFAADLLSFRRLTHVQGWRFEAIVLVRNGTVLFRNQGGLPRIERFEDRRQPLGPLQNAGESLSGRL